jgi:PAS domain S-box-containing protein
LDVNEEALRATGFTRDEVIGHTAEEIGFFEKGAREKIINEINVKGRVIDCEMTFHAKNGSLMWGILNAEQLVVNGNKCILTIVNDITSRKQAEESLRESGEYFRASFEYANIGACLVDANGKFLNVNDEYCRIVGYSHSELLQLTFNDITHPDDRTIGLNVHSKMQANETNQGRFEKRYIHKSGEIIWVRISNASVHDAQGDLQYVVAYVQDITDEKNAAQIIRESEENLKNAQKYARIGSWIWNVKTDQLDWTDEMFRIFGIAKESFTGRLQDVISRAIHPDDLPKVNESNASVINNSKPSPVEYRIIWPDGSTHVVWAEAGELVLDEDGRPSLLKGTVQDITERKHLEEEILRSEQKNRLLISQMHQGLAVHEVILDENGKPVDYRFLDVNESFERLTGLKAADLIGKRVLEVLPGTEKSWIEKYGQVALTGEPIEFEDLHSELDKYYGVVAYSPQPNQFAVIISDISDRKQKEIKINEQVEELRRWYSGMLGREKRTIELKNEVNQLLISEGKPPRYQTSFDTKQEQK